MNARNARFKHIIKKNFGRLSRDYHDKPPVTDPHVARAKRPLDRPPITPQDSTITFSHKLRGNYFVILFELSGRVKGIALIMIC